MPDPGFKLQSDYYQNLCLLGSHALFGKKFPEYLRSGEFLIRKVPHFEGRVEAGRGISSLSSLKHAYLQPSDLEREM